MSGPMHAASVQIASIIKALAAALFALAWTGCARQAAQESMPQAQLVETALVRMCDVPIVAEAFGIMAASQSVEVRSQVSGQIEAAHFNEGDRVEKGALLFSIDSRQYQASLAKAQASLNADIINLKKSQDLLARNKPLFEQNLISTQDFENLQLDAQAAMAQIEADKAALRQAELNLEYCSITAPISGIAGKRQVDPGNLVSAGSGSALVTIRALDPLFVDFSLPETRLAEVRQAMARGPVSVRVAPRGQTNTWREGALSMIENTVDTTAGAIALRGSIPNQDAAFWPGQFVDVQVVLGTASNAVVAPGSAVQVGKDGHYAYVLGPDNKVQLRPLALGPRHGSETVILKGLEPGEKVVTLGHLALYPGASARERASKTETAKEGQKPDTEAKR